MPSKKKKNGSSAPASPAVASAPAAAPENCNSEAAEAPHDLSAAVSASDDARLEEPPMLHPPHSSAPLPIKGVSSGTPQGLTMRQRLQALKESMRDQGVSISEPDRGGIGCTFERIAGENGELFVVIRMLKGGSAASSGVVAEGDALLRCNGQTIDNMLDLRDLVHGTIGDSVACVFKSRANGAEYDITLTLQPQPFDHVSVTTGSERAQLSPQKKQYTLSESSGVGHLDVLMQQLIRTEGLVIESDALYAGVQQNLVSTIQGGSIHVDEQERMPLYYNSDDGRNWKHEYEMLSLVLSQYQDMMDAHAASSESGAAALVVEERRVSAKRISELKENAAFLSEQLSSTRVQLAAKEQQTIQLHTALQHANDARALSDSNYRALQLSHASSQSLLQTLQAENTELVQKIAVLQASLKEQQRITVLQEGAKEQLNDQQKIKDQKRLAEQQQLRDLEQHLTDESQLMIRQQSVVQQQQQKQNDEVELMKHHVGSLSQQVQRGGVPNHAFKRVSDHDSALVPDNRIDLPGLEAKLKALSAGVYRDECISSSPSAANASSFPPQHDFPFPPQHDFGSSFKRDSASSFDKGTLLATMLLEQARQGRINVDTVHLQALRISLDAASPSLAHQHVIARLLYTLMFSLYVSVTL
jgi:hypothetical protein